MRKVISGGQTGCDQAALRAATGLGVATGGWAPQGWFTEDGRAPWLGSEYGLVECELAGYPARTEANVRDSDGTLILYWGEMGKGTALTLNSCRKRGGTRYLLLDLESLEPGESAWVARALCKYAILNVAGPRESSRPGIGALAEAFLTEVFTDWRRGPS